MEKNVLELYSKDTRVWIPSKEHVWISAIVTHPLVNGVLVVSIDNGESLTIQVNDESKLPPLCNPEILISVSDLTYLSFLHEPAVLHNLKIRFQNLSTIYTYCGIILVVINPYHLLPIYGNETIAAYHCNESRDMDPHVYGVMEQAFRQMIRENRNQSVIISGESGSGKTVSAKYALRYFASVCGAEAETKIEKKVLASNPIMESIGNAKTTRNDNSSRFGKYIEVGFTKTQSILGATMKTFLLEKSRVVAQGEKERNYHIFYQLCAMRDDCSLQELNLLPAEEFYYTRQGKSITVDGVNDQEDFITLQQSFQSLGFGSNQLLALYKLLAAILHLGNVTVHCRKGSIHEDASYIDSESKEIVLVSKLLGLSVTNLCKWLCNKKIVTKHDCLIKSFTMSQAVNARDSFSKHLYAQLFSWIVTKINNALESTERPTSFIGVLDIYGFEVFNVNSFEQFCINYANEKLQLQFNMHVFKLEQQEYIHEGIEWSFIQYYDNQPCIDLIDGQLGILDLLDETCKMPGSSDNMFIQKLYNNFINKPSNKLKEAIKYFSKPRTSMSSFNIHHYAYVVTYEKDFFTDKNMDALIPEHRELLQTSQEPFLMELFQSITDTKQIQRQTNGSVSTTKSTVGSQFRDSLTTLMNTLNSTTPHYIRCIKPNDSKSPFVFNPQRVIEQLRACGVLETIRISAAGFPSRCQYHELFCRYFMLLKWGQRKHNDDKLMANYILQNCINDSEKYRLGKTKIFFRAGQVAYLERLRTDNIHNSVIMIQSCIRGWSQSKKYRMICVAVRGIQKYSRGFIARRLALNIRQTRAAIKIQSVYRMFKTKNRYTKIHSCIVTIQCYYRRWRAVLLVNHLRLIKASIICQKHWRGRQAKQFTKWRQLSIVRVQCCVRMWSAKRELKAMKIEARSVDHFKSLNKGLEIKIIELKQKLIDQVDLNDNLTTRMNQLTISHVELSDKARYQDMYLEQKKKCIELETLINTTRTDKGLLEEQFNILKAQMEKTETMHKLEMETCLEHVHYLENKLTETQNTLKEKVHAQTETEWDKLKQDHILLQQHHQNMLLYTSELENQTTRLSTKLDLTTHSNNKHHSVLSDSMLTNKTGSPPNLTSIQLSDTSTEEYPMAAFLPTPLSLVTDSLNGSTDKMNHLTDSIEGSLELDQVNILADSLIEMIEYNHGVPYQLESTPNQCKSRSDQLESHPDQLKSHSDQLESYSDQLESHINSKSHNVQSLKYQLQQMSQRFHEFQVEQNHERALLEQRNRELQNELNTYKNNYQNDDYCSTITLNKSLQHEFNKLLKEKNELRAKMEVVNNSTPSHEVALIPLTPLKTRSTASFFSILDQSSSTFSSPVIYRVLQEKQCLGMLSWQLSDLPLILKRVILESNPVAGTSGVSCTEAHILFMCLRYADHCNSEEMASNFIEGVLSTVHKMLQMHRNNLLMLSYWLGNVTRFLNNLRQYSGNPLYQSPPTDAFPQSSQTCLTSFELSDYHNLIVDQAVYLYQRMFQLIKETIEPLIVPGLMEHNPLPGLSTNTYVGSIRRLLGGTVSKRKVSVEDVEKSLSQLMFLLKSCAVDPHLIGQLLKQIFHFINAHMLNYLLLRKDMCHWSRGVQMRYNLNVLEEWLRENWITETGNVEVSSMIKPIIQACKLLQMKKQTTNDIDEISELCKNLNSLQIQKLVTSSTGLEQHVPLEVIRYVTKRSTEKSINDPTTKLMTDASCQFPVHFPFSHSNVNYSDIKIPRELDYLIKI